MSGVGVEIRWMEEEEKLYFICIKVMHVHAQISHISTFCRKSDVIFGFSAPDFLLRKKFLRMNRRLFRTGPNNFSDVPLDLF